MAQARDPIEPESDLPPSSNVEEKRRATFVFRHQLLFLLGIFMLAVVGLFARASRVGVITVALLTGVCWILSGVYAIEGKRHGFVAMRTRWPIATVKNRPNRSTAVGAFVVGVLLIAMGAVFALGGVAMIFAGS